MIAWLRRLVRRRPVVWPDDDECVIDTCRFHEVDDGGVHWWGYVVRCIVTASDHACSTVERELFRKPTT